jgi:hypothetical protein
MIGNELWGKTLSAKARHIPATTELGMYDYLTVAHAYRTFTVALFTRKPCHSCIGSHVLPRVNSSYVNAP